MLRRLNLVSWGIEVNVRARKRQRVEGWGDPKVTCWPLRTSLHRRMVRAESSVALRASPERCVGNPQGNVPLFSREAREARRHFLHPRAV